MFERALTKEIIDFFLNISIFNNLNMEEIKVIAKHMNVIELKENEILFKENEKGSYMCFIVEGAVNVFKKSKTTNNEVIITTMQQGETLGEISIIDDKPRSATIKSVNDTKLYTLSKSAFDLLLERHSKIGTKLLKGITKHLCGQLREISKRYVEFVPSLS